MGENILNHQVKVSIIMGTHNDYGTIKECIASIIKQDYVNWEFIICDDCSEINYFNLLKLISKNDKRIKVIRNTKNRGLAFSLNRCLRISKGSLIARMDADDVSYSNRLSMQVAFLDAHPELCMVGSAMDIYDGDVDMGTRYNATVVERNDFLTGNPFFHPTMLIRRYVFKNIGLYNTEVKRVEDLELWFRVYAKGYKGANIQVPLYRYHESKADYKKRTLSAAFDITKVFIRGYKKIQISPIYYYRALRPIIAAIMPNLFLFFYHKKKLN